MSHGGALQTEETPEQDSPDPARLVGREWPVRVLRRGEVLWYQDDVAEELAYIESGGLEVLVAGRVVSTACAGELVGEASAFMPVAVRTATVRAAAPTVVRTCSLERIQALRAEHSEIYDALLDRALTELARRVRRSGMQLARLAEGLEARPSRDRLADRHEPASSRLHHHAARLALRMLPTLIDVAEEALSEIAGGFTSRMLEPGEILCMEGDVQDSLFLLGDGRLRIVRNVGSHKAVPVTTIERGELIGLLGMLLSEPRNATVIAEEACWVLEMSRAQHEALVGAVGRIWRETLLVALREHITSADDNLSLLQARRIDRINQKYALDDAISSIGTSMTWPIRHPERLARVRAEATGILHRIARHRRLLPGSEPCAHTPCEECFTLHRHKVERAVATGKPIHFILPAFPAKSPNRETKVLGKLPDMAEEQALRYLHEVCLDIKAVYPPGARVTICSDGRVFSDLVLVTDHDITAYGREIEAMIARLGMTDIDCFNLEDLFEVTTFEGMRDHLAVHYGEDIEQLRQQAREFAHHRAMVNGIHRFLVEDTVAVQKEKSRSRIKRECSGRAYEVIQRSNAFSRLIAECFPRALRLSIHPQPPHAAKIGILLGEAEGPWITPWHGVALRRASGEFVLTRRATAEKLGAVLVEREGRPSHFELRG